MLELIRKHSNSVVVKALLGVLVLTFVFCFGISDIVKRCTGKDYLVKIGNIKITPTQFNIEKAKKLNLLRNKVNKIDEKTETINILHQLIWENIIDLAAKSFGFIVSDETIKRYIANMPMFRDKNGLFRPEALRAFLYKIQVPEELFIALSKKDIKNALIKAPFKYVSVHNELDHYVKSQQEKRMLSIVNIHPEHMPISDNPPEAELKEFHEQNPDLFMEPEARSFRLFELHEKNIEKNIAVSKEEMVDFYETSAEKESKTYDEMQEEIELELKQEKLQSNVDNIVRQIEDALTGGENIDDIAKKYDLVVKNFSNITEDKTTPLQEVSYKNDIVAVVFATDEGMDSSFSETINEKEEKVLWFVRVDEVIPKHVSDFSDVSKQVRKELVRKKKHASAIKLANTLVKQVNSDQSLSQVASKKGFLSSVTMPFDRSGNVVTDSKNNKHAAIISQLYGGAFSASKNKAFFREMNGSIIVYQVLGVVSKSVVDAKTRTKLHESLLQEMGDDLYQQLISYLSKRKHEVKVNYEMIEKSENINFSEIEDMF